MSAPSAVSCGNTPAFIDGPVTLYQGDALPVLRELPDESVHCVVTSPPYWGLRDYGTATWEGGDPSCDHAVRNDPRIASSSLGGGKSTVGHSREGFKESCPRCGARRIDSQLGLEPTPEEYVANMVALFRDVRRVLRSDGTLWLNLGDSYASGLGSGRQGAQGERANRRFTAEGMGKPVPVGLKPKDLVGIPWRVAFALQADGWYLRSDIVWSKPNPMPESVTDRPTKAHEYVFLMTKAPHYFYDAEAVRETAEYGRSIPRHDGIGPQDHKLLGQDGGFRGGSRASSGEGGRNKRSVWEIATQPYPEAHFACVDEETECLTVEGWKRHIDLVPGLLAAQFDTQTGGMSWAPIEEVARYEVRDEAMVAVKTRDLDMVLTPNHRCVVQRRHPKTRQLQPPTIVAAENLRPSHHFPTAAEWSSPEGEGPMSETWAELLGWYVAEGHERTYSSAVEISQSASANPEKVGRIRALLADAQAETSLAPCPVAEHIRQRDESVEVTFYIPTPLSATFRSLAPGKRLPASVLLWDQPARNALLRGLVGGDGHRRMDGRSSFIQYDKGTADLVQALAVGLGYSASLSPRGEGWVVFLTKHRTRSLRGTAGRGVATGRVSYTGVVWCPKLPHGTWVARRNGKVFITGNTYPEDLVIPCVKAGTSERGCCPECGAPWRRLVERHAMVVRPGPTREAALAAGSGNSRRDVRGTMIEPPTTTTTGWVPGCQHGREPVPCTVLDPFAGSGTTLAVARRLGRRSVGIELNSEYVELIRKRVAGSALPLLELAAVHAVAPVVEMPPPAPSQKPSKTHCAGCGALIAEVGLYVDNDLGKWCPECGDRALRMRWPA